MPETEKHPSPPPGNNVIEPALVDAPAAEPRTVPPGPIADALEDFKVARAALVAAENDRLAAMIVAESAERAVAAAMIAVRKATDELNRSIDASAPLN